MKLYLARHGRTNYTDLNLCNGDPDVNVYITELGVKQGVCVARAMQLVPIGDE